MLASKLPCRQLKIVGPFTQYTKTVQIPEIVTVEHLKTGIHLVIENDQTGTVQTPPLGYSMTGGMECTWATSVSVVSKEVYTWVAV